MQKTQYEMERKTHSFFLQRKKEKSGEMERKIHSPKPKAKKKKDVVKWSVKRINNQFLFFKRKKIISLNALLLAYVHWISKSCVIGL